MTNPDSHFPKPPRIDTRETLAPAWHRDSANLPPEVDFARKIRKVLGSDWMENAACPLEMPINSLEEFFLAAEKTVSSHWMDEDVQVKWQGKLNQWEEKIPENSDYDSFKAIVEEK